MPEGKKPAWEVESAMQELELQFNAFMINSVGKDLIHEEAKS
jgi:hypothetical protein